jgi:hypothetical protein
VNASISEESVSEEQDVIVRPSSCLAVLPAREVSNASRRESATKAFKEKLQMTRNQDTVFRKVLVGISECKEG